MSAVRTDTLGSLAARRAVSTIFFINGAVVASWVPHIPMIKQRHQIGDGQLGLVLLSMAAGAVVALPMAGGLVSRFGSRRMTTVAVFALCLALPLPVLSPNVALLCVSLLLLGACNGTLDVSMNAQALVVERGYQRAIMSSFHGLFSLGGLVGAAVAGQLISLGVAPAGHVLATTLVALLAATLASRRLVPSPPSRVNPGPVFARPTGALLTLGLLAFLGLLAEGAMADWSAVYLHDVLKTTPGLAAAGFAAFSLTMAAGRFVGDSIVGRFGPDRVLRMSAVLAAGGLAAALVIGQPFAAVAGCAAVGFGIANIIPILFSAAGRIPDVEPGKALAAVATTGYFGLLAGPPLIGLVAEFSGLPLAFGLVSAACALIAWFGVDARGSEQQREALAPSPS